MNDRGGIKIGKGAVIGSFARIFSHTSSPDDLDQVKLTPTTIGAGARIGSHEIVLGGTTVPDGKVVGTSRRTEHECCKVAKARSIFDRHIGVSAALKRLLLPQTNGDGFVGPRL